MIMTGGPAKTLSRIDTMTLEGQAWLSSSAAYQIIKSGQTGTFINNHPNATVSRATLSRQLQNPYKSWLYKTVDSADTVTCVIDAYTGYAYNSCTSTLGDIHLPYYSMNVAIFPNPVERTGNTISLSVESQKYQCVNLRIYDFDGVLLESFSRLEIRPPTTSLLLHNTKINKSGKLVFVFSDDGMKTMIRKVIVLK